MKKPAQKTRVLIIGAILLSILLMLLCSSCGKSGKNSGSGLTINAVEAKLSKDEEWSFEKELIDNDYYSFKYTLDTYTQNIEYTGSANKNECVYYLHIKYNDLNLNKLKSQDQIAEICRKTSDQLTISDLRVLVAVYDTWVLLGLFDQYYGTSTLQTVLPTIVSIFNGSRKTVGGWTVEAVTSYDTSTMELTARFQN